MKSWKNYKRFGKINKFLVLKFTNLRFYYYERLLKFSILQEIF